MAKCGKIGTMMMLLVALLLLWPISCLLLQHTCELVRMEEEENFPLLTHLHFPHLWKLRLRHPKKPIISICFLRKEDAYFYFLKKSWLTFTRLSSWHYNPLWTYLAAARSNPARERKQSSVRAKTSFWMCSNTIWSIKNVSQKFRFYAANVWRR